MLSQPIFDNRALTESLYRALVNRFYDSLNLSTQALLDKCTLGFAPSPEGVKTFFIVAPSVTVGDQVIEELDNMVNGVVEIMVGVGQIAVCINPVGREEQTADDTNDANQSLPQYMACQFFVINCDNEWENDLN